MLEHLNSDLAIKCYEEVRHKCMNKQWSHWRFYLRVWLWGSFSLPGNAFLTYFFSRSCRTVFVYCIEHVCLPFVTKPATLTRKSSLVLLVIFRLGIISGNPFTTAHTTLQLLSAGGSMHGKPERKLSPGTDTYCCLGGLQLAGKRSLFSRPLPSLAFLQISSAEAPISAH